MESRRKLVLILSLLIITFLLIGTFSYHKLEGWNYMDSFYFSTITLTTIGYGELHPTNDTSKIFTIIFVLSGVGIFLFALTVISSNIEHHEFINRKIVELVNKGANFNHKNKKLKKRK